MNEPTSVPREVAEIRFWRLPGAALAMFRRTWKGLVFTGVLFRAFSAIVGAAGSAIVLSWVMGRTGREAVTNADITSLLLTPPGILLVLVAISGAAFLALAEQGALMLVAAVQDLRPAQSAGRLAPLIGTAVARIARLAVILVCVALAVVVPVVAVVGGVYRAALGGHDVNYYLASRPPAFLAVAAFAAALLVATVVVLATWTVRWIVAVPIVLFEARRPVDALGASHARVRGSGWRVAALIGGWQIVAVLVGALCYAGFRWFAGAVFERAAGSTAAAVVSVASLVVLHFAGAAVASFIGAAGIALLVLRLHIAAAVRAGVLTETRVTPPAGGAETGRRSLAPLVAGAVVLVVAGAVAVSALLARRLAALGHTEITAHRGCSRLAPENTLSAIRKAIEAGADWAEIDVQETRDGAVVVLHDRDLMRLGDDPRRLSDLTLAELKTIDVGRKFGPAFAGERVPTLEEAIALARGKIRFNIELKYYGRDPRLARDVARIIHEQRFETECFVASLAYPSLLEARNADPGLRTAAIVAAAVGDVTRLDADVLSVNANLLSFRLLRNARRQGKPLHAWTVDSEKTAVILMGRGVANIITNDPERMVRARREWEARSPAEKLLMTFRDVLGLAETRSAEAPKSDQEL